MNKKSFVELREANDNLYIKMQNLSDTAKAEKREFTSEEKAEYDAMEREYAQNERSMKSINLDAENMKAREVDNKFNFMQALRDAKASRESMNLRTALTAAGLANKAVEVQLQSILKPLYEKSALAQLGVKWYKGMPMGDISIPVMNKANLSWEGETAAPNSDSTPTFGTNITLKPYRLTGYFEISEKMLLQDTIGVEAAIKEEAINALANAFEATVLGNESGTVSGTKVKPDGIFYNKTLKSAKTFAEITALESEVEDNCVGGELKYLLGTKAKADLRAMAKSSKNTQLVMEGGQIDGTPTVVSTNVKKTTVTGEGEAATSHVEGPYVYGNFQNLACASWSDLIFKVDDSIAYGNGKIRIYVSGYFDAAVLRDGAFVYGNTRYTA